MPLYGHELGEDMDPISAGLGWAVSTKKEFIGSTALKDFSPIRKLVGLELDGKRIARQGANVIESGKTVGTITSGTLSPTLNKSIAMAYVDAALAVTDTTLAVDLRGEANPCKVVPLPFYKRVSA